MKPKLTAIFLIMVLAPLAAMGWLMVRAAEDEKEMIAHRFDELLQDRLTDVEAVIGATMESKQRTLSEISMVEMQDAATLRELVRHERLVRQVFVIDATGKLAHPPLDEPRNKSEDDFLSRTDHIWKSRESFFRPADSASADGDAQGWYTWYWGGGLNFIFWKKDNGGRIIGIEVDRLTLLSHIVGELPETAENDDSQAKYSIQLVDANGHPVYVWGGFEPSEDEAPRATMELRPPLGAWRLHYYPAPGAMGDGIGENLIFSVRVSLAALALVVLGLAIYFFKESGRDAREARKRVTFVNQVSHELKTPLTNIRMYAELLDDQLDEEDDKPRDYLDVIVSESQRLSRLIGNVLSFARKQKKKLTVRPARGKINDALEAILAQFKPSLESAGFEIETSYYQDDEWSMFDADALGQIVGNLVSNVEKYASDGKWFRIETRREGELILITLSDRGKGIPAASRKKIFQPFVRLSGKVEEGASGTGIGLPIARDLARLHGGDLVLVPDSDGAVFEITLDAPLATGDERQ